VASTTPDRWNALRQARVTLLSGTSGMIRFRTLGALDLQDADGAQLRSGLTQPKRLALLAYLAIARPGDFHRRDTLVALLWPELDADHGRAALSQALYYLRRSLGREILISRGQEEVKIDPSRLWCDAAMLERALEAGTADELADALKLYRGDLLPGLFVSDSPAFEDWLERKRARLRRRVGEAARMLSERAEADGSLQRATRWARQALEVGAHDEAALRRVIQLLDRMGDRAGAIRTFESAAQRLAREYDLEPAPETERLIAEIRDRSEPNDPVAAPPASADGGVRPGEIVPEAARGDPAVVSADEPRAASAHPDRSRSAGRWRKGWLVATASLAIAVLVFTLVRPTASPGGSSAGTGVDAADPQRVAVLPLANLGRAELDDYIADGLTSELIARLARLGGLRVVPFASVRPYRRSERTVEEVGRELQVSTIIEGDARKVGDRVRVTVRLIDVETEDVLWAGVHNARLIDLLEVQRGIAEEVARALKIETRTASERRTALRSRSPEGYDEYLRGRALLGRLDAPSLLAAREHFLNALSHDDRFAEAWSGLASAINRLLAEGILTGPAEWEQARRAAEQALALDSELPEAHAALATFHSFYDWDAAEAERRFQRAIELDPSFADAYREYAVHLRNLGRFDEALDQIRRARSLDSRSPPLVMDEALVLYLSRRTDEAIAVVRRLLTEMPATSGPAGDAPADTPAYRPRLLLALALLEKGEYEEALTTMETADPASERPATLMVRAYVRAKDGHPEEARRILRAMDDAPTTPPVSPFQKATVHVALGEHDRAMELLEEAAAAPRPRLVRLLGVEPKYDPLRSNPRFQALLRRLELPGIPGDRPDSLPTGTTPP
jgi:TolB-like protein/DNA-binding SARP family transcriptional activator/Tfp pilus assembly protein PilF